MDTFSRYRYVDLLFNKYLDRSVYSHDRAKTQFYSSIADRLFILLKQCVKELDVG